MANVTERDLQSAANRDPDAQTRIYNAFINTARSAAMARLSNRVRVRADGTQVAIDGMRSVLSDLEHGRFVPESLDDFEKKLVKKVSLRAISAARKATKKRDDIRRDSRMSDAKLTHGSGDAPELSAASRELEKEMTKIINRIAEPLKREAVRLVLLFGYTGREAAKTVSNSPAKRKTVKHKTAKNKKKTIGTRTVELAVQATRVKMIKELKLDAPDD